LPNVLVCYNLLVNKLIAAGLIKGVVESEVLVVQVLGQVDLRLGLVHDRLVLVGDGDDVNLPAVLLLLVQRSLAHADSDLDIVGQS